MEKLDLTGSKEGRDERAPDLARRLARYRRRLEAAGLKRSLRVIDRAIDDAADDADGKC